MTAKSLLPLISLMIAGIAAGQSSEDARRAAAEAEDARLQKLFRTQNRAWQIRPNRRENPSRAENISDNEVREIQTAISEMLPGAILNIGTVVVGCPCEDGASCSDQVWVVAHRPQKTKGLLLSKIDGRWTIGPVQRWWLDREDLDARGRKGFPSLHAYMMALAGPGGNSVVSSSGTRRLGIILWVSTSARKAIQWPSEVKRDAQAAEHG